MTEQTDVSLSDDVIRRVEQRVSRTEFESVSEYIEFVLEEALYHVEAEADTDDATEQVDESEVRDRLKSLGYLDDE